MCKISGRVQAHLLSVPSCAHPHLPTGLSSWEKDGTARATTGAWTAATETTNTNPKACPVLEGKDCPPKLHYRSVQSQTQLSFCKCVTPSVTHRDLLPSKCLSCCHCSKPPFQHPMLKQTSEVLPQICASIIALHLQVFSMFLFNAVVVSIIKM